MSTKQVKTSSMMWVAATQIGTCIDLMFLDNAWYEQSAKAEISYKVCRVFCSLQVNQKIAINLLVRGQHENK